MPRKDHTSLMIEIYERRNEVEAIASKLFTGSWTDFVATTMQFQRNKNRMGIRIHLRHYHAWDSIEIKAIQGDGREVSFREFAKATLNAPTVDAVLSVVKTFVKLYF